MSRFIQSLERRALLSVSTTSLASELSNVTTDAATVKADLATLQTTAKADLKAIQTDLKGSPKSGGLFGKLQSDENKWLGKLKADVTALLPAATKSATYVKDGNGVLATPNNNALRQKVKGDVTALGSATTTPLAKLMADSSTTGLTTDLNALTSANPSNTALSGAVTTAKTDLNNLSGKLVSDAGKFATAVGALKTDLTSLEPIVPVPTTNPSLVGDYKGTLKTKAVAFGVGSVTTGFELNITSQTINSLTGTLTVSGSSNSGTFTASELSNGNFTIKTTGTGITITLNGSVNVFTTKTGLAPGSVISGSGSVNIAGFSISGSFIATKM
ncbi:MAG TPA: hypothetical protein VK797_09115 [Tepidisphaeraceae bacterium]|nr:hypothetical protein [Tepidisphaeraceae bacterium]